MLASYELHQITLDLFRVLVFRQAKPLGQPDHMRVHYDPFVFSKRVAQHHIRRFSAIARMAARMLFVLLR